MKFFLPLFFLFSSFLAFSQVDSISLMNTDEMIFDQMNQFLDNNESDEVDLGDELETLFPDDDVRYNVNNISPEVAFQILKLSDYQYYQLLLYIENYGFLVSLFEIMAIDGFDYRDYIRLLPFIEVIPLKQNKFSFAHFFKYSKQSLLIRYGQIIENQDGYDTSRSSFYLGTPQRYCFKYRFSSQNRFLFAISGEKDAGEQFFRGSQKKGFDLYSFFVSVKQFSIIKNVVIGDFRINFGQGLVAGSGLMSAKGANLNAVRKLSSTISPVALMNESSFFRGIACELGNYTFSGTLFYGHSFRDGDVFKPLLSDSSFFDGSLSINGSHRTFSEVNRKNSLFVRNYGGNFIYRNRLLKIGLSLIHTDFKSIISKGTSLYNIFDFEGKQCSNIGLDFHFIIKKAIVFGEFALADNYSLALLTGSIFNLSPDAKMLFLFRYYSPHYHALFANAFGENGNNKNEIGGYSAINLLLGRRMELNFYADYAFFKWLKFRVNAPSFSFDMGSTLHYKVSNNCKMMIKYSYKRKSKNSVNQLYYTSLETITKQLLKCSVSSNLFSWLTLKTEFDAVTNKSMECEKRRFGILLFQDVGLNIVRIPLKVNVRLALFTTDSYDERLYAYENDLYYSFTVSSYYDKGCRFFIMLKYKVANFDFWLRFSQTYFMDKDEIGSGLERIEGNVKSDIKLQMLVKL